MRLGTALVARRTSSACVTAQACPPACAGAWDAAQPERATGQPGYLAGGFRLVVAANKADLLPRHIPRARLEVRNWREALWRWCPVAVRPCSTATVLQ